jgi:radical SAM superfamily enzyme with C-terminal helix-hairpin-helix motif
MSAKGVGKAVILDGYVDEPTALGVPPYLAPYPRYVVGVFEIVGIPWHYTTIDAYRTDPAWAQRVADLEPSDLLVVIAGLTVPGHYRGGTPLTLHELRQIASHCRATVMVGGPVRHGYTLTGGSAALDMGNLEGARVVHGEPALEVDAFVRQKDMVPQFSYQRISEMAVRGAAVAAAHPSAPRIIAEIETARGCERTEHCSFCTEGLVQGCEFRPAAEIIAEIRALYQHGVRHFRLGKQPNFFAWPGRRDAAGVVRPAPQAIASLYRDIHEAAPELRTLHIDNVNPGFVARHPDECLDIARTVAEGNTPGDVAAMGVESVDPEVVRLNRLGCTPEEALKAIRIINRAGAVRQGASLPKLLPGLNFLYGLQGETAATYETNYRFLLRLLEEGLLVRRINLRQVMVFPGTPLHQWTAGKPKINKVRFRRWKRRVQEDVEHPMLQQVAPVGTILPDVHTEFRDGDVTFGRQLASYPILAGIPLRLGLRETLDAVVVGHGLRSVTVLPYPIKMNQLSVKALCALPGVGKPRALRLERARPFANVEKMLEALDDPSALAPLSHLVKLD